MMPRYFKNKKGIWIDGVFIDSGKGTFQKTNEKSQIGCSIYIQEKSGKWVVSADEKMEEISPEQTIPRYYKNKNAVWIRGEYIPSGSKFKRLEHISGTYWYFVHDSSGERIEAPADFMEPMNPEFLVNDTAFVLSGKTQRVGGSFELIEAGDPHSSFSIGGKAVWLSNAWFPALRKGVVRGSGEKYTKSKNAHLTDAVEAYAKEQNQDIHKTLNLLRPNKVDVSEWMKNASKKEATKMPENPKKTIEVKYLAYMDGSVFCSCCHEVGLMLNQFGYCAACWADVDQEQRAAMAGIEIVQQIVRETVIDKTVTLRMPHPRAWQVGLYTMFCTILGCGIAQHFAAKFEWIRSLVGL